MANKKEYTEPMREKFVDLAQKVGIGRAIKELGYPSWPTGKDWCDARGVLPAVDTMMQEVKKFHTFYETTDALLIAEEGMALAREKIVQDHLDPDGFKKVAEAYQKLTNTWLVLQGKAANITQTNEKDTTHLELMSLLEEQVKANDLEHETRELVVA